MPNRRQGALHRAPCRLREAPKRSIQPTRFLKRNHPQILRRSPEARISCSAASSSSQIRPALPEFSDTDIDEVYGFRFPATFLLTGGVPVQCCAARLRGGLMISMPISAELVTEPSNACTQTYDTPRSLPMNVRCGSADCRMGRE
jgi:hypothetical protein